MNRIKKACKNLWVYYALKWGLIKSGSLILNTAPQNIRFFLAARDLKRDKGLLKDVFRLVADKRLEYRQESGSMSVYSRDRKRKAECALNLPALPTVAQAVDSGFDLSEYNAGLFKIEIKGAASFLVRKNTVSDVLCLRENFIKRQYARLFPYVKGSVVLDIGAYVGDTAVLFALQGARKVYAYEPHPDLFKLCSDNLRLNGLEKIVEADNYGVGDKDGEFNLKEDGIKGAGVTFGLVNQGQGGAVRIKVRSLSRIIKDLKSVDVVKMDCEGAEFAAVLSCPEAELRRVKAWCIEYHDDPGQLIGCFRRSGFNVNITDNTKTASRWTGLLFAFFV